MNIETLPVFEAEQFRRAKLYLSTQVADMMGRKLEEGDWARVYCAAKGIPMSGWSNTDIDIVYGPLGVEQKAMRRRSDQSITEACGTMMMHPAGTRSIRFPQGVSDATSAAREVLSQYGEIIANRTLLVDTINRFHHGILNRHEAVAALQSGIKDMSRRSAEDRVPRERIPNDQPVRPPDMRMGWLLWQDSLREFLYFEERMAAPNPALYFGEWNDRPASGSRKATRNLWVFDRETGEKHFSVTVEAGVKIQPYFKVPAPGDANLYHFVVQGERAGEGLVRVWLSRTTADLLSRAVGGLDPGKVAEAIFLASKADTAEPLPSVLFKPVAVELLVPLVAYDYLVGVFEGVSDEHNFKQLVDFLVSKGTP